MLDQFADWMAQHAQVKVTTRIEYRDGTYVESQCDYRPKPKQKTPNK